MATTAKKKTTTKSVPDETQMMLAILNQLDTINEAIGLLNDDLKGAERKIDRLAERVGLPL